ncbi:MAG: hypothetical protein OXI16_05850 [Chloroflexota bacterium]|nr:hypothetical protein [Chloroflexota bacterium]
MTKIVCWNINKKQAPWRELVKMADAGDADVALLQEAGNPPWDIETDVDTGPSESWDSRVWNADYEKLWGKEKLRERWGRAGLYDRWCKVVKLSNRVEVEWFKQISPISGVANDEIAVSGIGTIAAACVTPKVPQDGEPFIVVSMYARWLRWHPTVKSPWSVGTSDGSAHRILAAGDLNMIYNPGDPEWIRSRDNSVWTRMNAMGLEFMGPCYPNGRKAFNQRDWLAPNSLNVPTYYTVGEKTAEAASQQLDYAFASRGFHKSVRVRAMNEVDEWGPSDHCRLLIEVGASSGAR